MDIAKVGKVTAGVALLLVAAGYGALSSIDVESYRDDIIKAAEDATGRNVEISGPIKLRVSLTPAVVVEGLKMSNAPWAKAPTMISIGKAEAEIGLLSAIFGSIEVNRLLVHDTTIALQRRADGSANWELGEKDASTDDAKDVDDKAETKPSVDGAKDDGGDTPSIAIRSVDIRNLKVALDDAVTGQKLSVDVKTLAAAAKSFSDPVKLTLDMLYNGMPINAKGLVGPVENLTANDETKVDLTVEVPGVKVSAKGDLGHPMAAKDIDLAVGFEGTSYDALSKSLSVDLSGVPAMSLTTKVETFDDAGYRLHDGILKLGDQTIQLSASADLEHKVPVVKAQISADVLDLPKLLASLEQTDQGGKPEAAPSSSKPATQAKGDGKIFPADPLPVEALRGVDLDAGLDVKSLTVPSGIVLKDTKVAATLKNGTLMVKPKFGIGGGQIDGAVTLVTPKSKGSSALSVKLNSQKVALADVAAEAGMMDLMTGGATDIHVNLSSRGSSVRSLMAGLNGNVSVDTGKSEIVNAKLSEALGSWAMSGLTMIDPTFAAREKTMLSCMVVRVPVKKGMATIDNSIAMETDVMNVVVDGDVNLKTEGLNLGLDTQPHGVGTGIAQTATGLVRVGGTLGDPSVGISALGAGKAALKVGAAIATGGLSLLGDAVLNEATKDAHPCLTAKGIKAKSGSAKSKSSKKTTTQKQVNPAAAIGGAMKGLFGK